LKKSIIAILLASALSHPLAAAPANDDAAQLTQALVAQQQRLAQAQDIGRQKQRLIELAETRADVLAGLMDTDPGAVFRVALPDQIASQMPAEIQDLLLRWTEVEGTLEILVEDRESLHDSIVHHVLNTPAGERISLHFASAPEDLQSGQQARVNGLFLPNGTDGDNGDLAVGDDGVQMLALDGTGNSGTGGLPYAIGQQRYAVIMVNFEDDLSQPWSMAQVDNLVFNQADAFIRENSKNASWLNGNVFGWFTIPMSKTVCDINNIPGMVYTAAANAGVDLSSYPRRMIVFPYATGCKFGGMATVGGGTSVMMVNGSFALTTFVHEIGHNLGLYHGKALECGSAVMGSTCTSDEYGDYLDPMGKGAGHYNVFHKERMGWHTNGDVQPVTTPAQFLLSGYASSAIGIKALKVPGGSDAASGNPVYFYLSYRQPVGYDSAYATSANITNGVVVQIGTEHQPESSHLLDMTPGSGSNNYTDSRDPALTSGLTFNHPASGVSITTQWVDGTQALVSVVPGNTPTATCTAAAPGLALSGSPSDWVTAGSAVNFTLTVTNHDSSACVADTFDIAAQIQSNWTASYSDNSVTLAPGATASVTVVITSPSNVADGFYDIPLQADNANFVSTVQATYVVDSPVTSNSAPVAVDDAVTITSKTAVTINVLNNDSDPEGDALSVIAVSSVDKGSVDINANGSITYTPAKSFKTSGSFVYTISDGQATTQATATISLQTSDGSGGGKDGSGGGKDGSGGGRGRP